MTNVQTNCARRSEIFCCHELRSSTFYHVAYASPMVVSRQADDTFIEILSLEIQNKPQHHGLQSHAEKRSKAFPMQDINSFKDY